MSNNNTYDLIIIGSGPAGLSAAVYAQRAALSTIVLEKMPFSGGQIINTTDIDNYLGLGGITGFDLSQKFKEHAENLEAEIITKEVEKINKNTSGFSVICSDDTYKAKSVIIASGATRKKLGIEGEEKFIGRGVSYCAACDAAFYRDKTVAVIGGGDTAVEDAILLSNNCKKVYLIHRRDTLRAAKTNQEVLKKLKNVEIIWDSNIKGILGENSIEKINVENLNGKKDTINVDGVFVAIGLTPNTEYCKGFIELDKDGFIVANEEGITSIEGIYAAGDIRTKALRQVVTAAADGANALFSAEKYISTKAV